MDLPLLVFLPTGRDAVLTEQLLSANGITALMCRSAPDLADRLYSGTASDLVSSAGADAGALLVSEEALAVCGRLLHRFVANQDTWSDLPILLLTRNGMDSLETQRALEQLGNVTLLERPVRTMALVSFVRSALRARARQYEVRALDKRKDQFLATLAHELRNPLAPIMNATSIFERLHPSAQTTRLVDMVQRQLSHLTRLIDDLMDVARINSGKIHLQNAPTTAQRVVHQAMEIAGDTLRERGHTVVVALPPREVPVAGDHVRLVQSLANVVVNASKFTPPGGDVSVSAKVRGRELVFVVKDTGQGLPPKALSSVFGMFAQERAVGEPSNGLGIGLHLAKTFVQMHGGTITAHSDGPGLGSEFVITLPLADTVGNAPATKLPISAESAILAPQRSVLIVDDNEDAAKSFAELLAIEGITTAVAHDGHAAVRQACDQKPDVVLMDIGMPELNGYEAARAIRTYFQGAGPVLLAMTGWGQHADQQRAREAGFDFHFVKPLSVQRLLDFLRDPPLYGRQASKRG